MRCLLPVALLLCTAWADDKAALRRATIKQIDTAYKSGDWQLDKDFAVAAAEALARYWVIELKPLLAAVSRLANQLEGFLHNLAAAREKKDRAAEKHNQVVSDALLRALRKLSDKEGLKTPEDFRKWVRNRRRELKIS